MDVTHLSRECDRGLFAWQISARRRNCETRLKAGICTGHRFRQVFCSVPALNGLALSFSGLAPASCRTEAAFNHQNPAGRLKWTIRISEGLIQYRGLSRAIIVMYIRDVCSGDRELSLRLPFSVNLSYLRTACPRSGRSWKRKLLI